VDYPAVSKLLFSKFQVGTRLTNSRLSDESLKAPGGCGGTSVEFTAEWPELGKNSRAA
jgi:hypothetical protein